MRRKKVSELREAETERPTHGSRARLLKRFLSVKVKISIMISEGQVGSSAARWASILIDSSVESAERKELCEQTRGQLAITLSLEALADLQCLQSSRPISSRCSSVHLKHSEGREHLMRRILG